MSDHQKFVALAERLITKHGRQINISKWGKDPDAPGWGEQEPVLEWSEDVVAVNLPASGSSMGSLISNKDLLRKVSSVWMIYPIDGRDLSQLTTIVDRTVTQTVEWVEPLQPGDQLIMYIVGAKQ